ncbi:MAG: IS1182 family transposase, partial [Thermodesulfobacteriota bacterium]
MKYIQGQDRFQTCIFPVSLDASIDENNEVRIIDLFVESLDLNTMGFEVEFVENGRPAYHPKDLLKLYIYGYLNRIRSSRDLEKETKRNIEVLWLLKGLSPDHNTINNFRKNNPKAIKKVFRRTVEIAGNFDLIGGILIAGDSTKLRAQNSKKNNYNQKKINRHLAYIDRKLEEYNQALVLADGDQKQELEKKINKQKTHQSRYQEIEKQLIESGEKQVSTSDPESRQIMIRGVISEVAYNVQSTVDAKNKLPIDYEVTNENDSGAMGNMVKRAKTILGKNDFSVLFDKGYHKGKELDTVQKLGIKTYVAIPGIPKTSQAPNPAYNAENFTYDTDSDTYTCPAHQTLESTQTWYKTRGYKFKQYKTVACSNCPVRSECTKSKNGKIIHRSEYQPAVEQNRINIEADPDFYKQRQSLVEHPFGTMKRQWGFDHIMTKKSKKHASADVGLIFVAYNLRRLINIIGIKKFKEYLRPIVLQFFDKMAHQLQYSFLTFRKPILNINSWSQSKSLQTTPKTEILSNLLFAA